MGPFMSGLAALHTHIGMTYYESEILRMKWELYPNRAQLHTVMDIRRYIDHRYATDIDLDRLSHTGLVSKYHMLRLFRRYYGQTPGQYLTDRRMERAMACLRAGMSVADTCYAVGFGSPSSFSTLFRSRTGLSPTGFQKRAIFATPV